MERAVEASVEAFEEMRTMPGYGRAHILRRIAEEMYSVLSIQAGVKLVEPRTIERSMGKAKRVIDKRKQ